MRSASCFVEKEEPEFKVNLRIEGIAQDVIPEYEERVSQIQKVIDKLRTGYHTKSIIEDLVKAEKIHQVQRRVESYNSRTWQHWIARAGTYIQMCPMPILLEARTGGIDLLFLRHLSTT